MSKHALTILFCIAIAVVLIGCDTNRTIQSDGEAQAEQSSSEQTQAVENLTLKEFEPSPELREKAKQYAKWSEKDPGEKFSRKRVKVTYGKKEGPTLAFENQQEFKAYQQAKARISKHESKSLHIYEGLEKYEKYAFVSKGELHALNHNQQVVINDTLYRLRGEKEVTMLGKMRPNPPEFERASLPHPTSHRRSAATASDRRPATLGSASTLSGGKARTTASPAVTSATPPSARPATTPLPSTSPMVRSATTEIRSTPC